MCLAILVPKGTDKYSDSLKKSIVTASHTNDDGMGFAFKRSSTGKVFISKGYKDVKELMEAIESKKLKKADELIIHLRIGNKGAVNTDMCHPFVASDIEEVVLSNNKFVDHPVFIHNGTLTKYALAGSKFSDTYWFAKDFMSHPLVADFLKKDPVLFAKMFKEHLSTSRFVFLFPNEDTEAICLGDFIQHDGSYYSNTSYKDSTSYNIGGKTYHNSYRGKEYYDDFDWDDRGSDYQYNLNRTLSRIGQQSVAEAAVEKEIIVPYVREDAYWKRPRYMDKSNGKSYELYMGLWLPIKTVNDQFEEMRVNVNFLNYDQLSYQGRDVNGHSDVLFGRHYKISDYDLSSEKEENAIHTLTRSVVNDAESIYVIGNEINELFAVTPKMTERSFYHTYYKLVRDITVTKKECKRLSRLLKCNKDKIKLSYKSFNDIHRDILELLLYNMFVEMYPKDYQKQYMNKAF